MASLSPGHPVIVLLPTLTPIGRGVRTPIPRHLGTVFSWATTLWPGHLNGSKLSLDRAPKHNTEVWPMQLLSYVSFDNF